MVVGTRELRYVANKHDLYETPEYAKLILIRQITSIYSLADPPTLRSRNSLEEFALPNSMRLATVAAATTTTGGAATVVAATWW